MAQREKEYELLIRDKIRDEIAKCDCVIGIITKESLGSASVNQELGYALGNDVPVIIMIEKDAKLGVLTHGIEPEEFTRDDFQVHCKNVRTYILEKGVRKSVKKEDRVWLQQNVYRVLYNEIADFNNALFYSDSLPKPLNKIDNYSKLKVEPRILNLCEKYTEEVNKWSRLYKDSETDFSHKEVALGEIFKDCFAKVSLLNAQGYIIMDERSSQEPRHWVSAFRFVLFNETAIRNSQTLYEMLIAYASATNRGHLRWLQKFKTKTPHLFDCIFDKLPEARKLLNSDITEENLAKKRERSLRSLLVN